MSKASAASTSFITRRRAIAAFIVVLSDCGGWFSEMVLLEGITLLFIYHPIFLVHVKRCDKVELFPPCRISLFRLCGKVSYGNFKQGVRNSLSGV